MLLVRAKVTMTTTQIATPNSLYEMDYLLWVEDTLEKLRLGDFSNLDRENLMEEVADLGRSYRDELESRWDVLLSLLLKRIYIPLEYEHNGWERTIREQRKQIKCRLAKSPSLENYLGEIFEQIWADALQEVREDYPDYKFPDTWQFGRDVEVILNHNFWE